MPEPIFEHKYMVAALKKKMNELLEKEKQMVIDARVTAPLLETIEIADYIKEAEDYYTQTFKNDKS